MHYFRKGIHMITEKDMQYVLTIANYGNLTKAANALFLSQPALSIHLKQLETSLGIQLFERKGRRMILTYAGEEFVKSARDITMKCFELEDRMIDIGKNVAVKLRVGYMVRQVESLFPSVMTAFNRLYPQSVVYAIDGHLSDHEEQLLAGDLDMFFGYNSVSNTRLSYETIYEDCLVAILPKSHPAVSFAESKESCVYPWLDLAHVRKERFILQHSNQSIRHVATPRDYLKVEAVAAYNTTDGHLQFHPKEREDCGYVLTIGGSRIYIAGDTEPTPELKALKNIDIAFLPVNQPYTMTVDQAVEAVKAIRPTIFYPYHYGEVEEKTDIDRLARELEGVTEVRIRPME